MTIHYKNRLLLSFLTATLLSAQAFAEPAVTFKDLQHNTRYALSSATMPSKLNVIIKKIQTEQPTLQEIIVYKNNDHYLLYLLSGTTWSIEKIRVDLDASSSAAHVINNYSGSLEDIKPSLKANNEASGVCPDTSIEFLVISGYPNIASVNASIATVSEAAKKKYKTMTILNRQADAITYKNWLSCPNLKGVYSIGHGSPQELIVGNHEVLSYSFFSQPDMVNKFKSTTVIINSCQVYNYPLGTNIMYGNALEATEFSTNPGPNTYEFMGGHTNLLMNSSEESSACFTAKAIEGARMDYDTLKQCISDKDIHFQNFGLSNPGRYFNSNK